MSTALITRPVSLAPDLPPLQGVQLPDGQVGATLRSLCTVLQLNALSQQRRIERSRSLRGASMTVTITTRGGPQEMTVLLAWIIPLWVVGIQANRLDAAKRDRILIIQTQAVQALYKAFVDRTAPVERAIESEIVSDAPSGAGLEARLAAIEATLRDLVREVNGPNGRVRVTERILAALTERVLWVQNRPMQVAQQQQKLPGSRRGRPRRGGSDKR